MAKSEDEAPRSRNWLGPTGSRIGVFPWGWVLLGVVLFVIGAGVQLVPARYPELAQLLQRCEHVPKTCSAAVLDFDLRAHRASDFSIPFIAGDLLRSMGAAVVVSIVITATVESRGRREFDELTTRKAREIGESVFAGMFNRRHPESLLNAVKEQILERDLVRDHLDVTYTLSEIAGPSRDGAPETLVLVDVILSTTTRNVSTLRGEAGRAKVPLALVLPNPQIGEMKRHVAVSGFVVDKIPKSKDEVEKVNAALQSSLCDDEENEAFADFGHEIIEAGQKLSLSANYTMIKELEDTEVFRSLQICRSLSLTVVDKTGLDFHVQAKSMHPGRLEMIGSAGSTMRWQLADIILPQQGIMVFWKRRRAPAPALPGIIPCDDGACGTGPPR